MATLRLGQGLRPKKPVFAMTRGYTDELWQMTTSCWEEDPNSRPTVDSVLDVLRGSAEGWGTKHAKLTAPSSTKKAGPGTRKVVEALEEVSRTQFLPASRRTQPTDNRRYNPTTKSAQA